MDGMDDYLFGKTDLDSLEMDSDGFIEMERKVLFGGDHSGTEYFRNGLSDSHPNEGMVTETLNAWRGFESFA